MCARMLIQRANCFSQTTQDDQREHLARLCARVTLRTTTAAHNILTRRYERMALTRVQNEPIQAYSQGTTRAPSPKALDNSWMRTIRLLARADITRTTQLTAGRASSRETRRGKRWQLSAHALNCPPRKPVVRGALNSCSSSNSTGSQTLIYHSVAAAAARLPARCRVTGTACPIIGPVSRSQLINSICFADKRRPG